MNEHAHGGKRCQHGWRQGAGDDKDAGVSLGHGLRVVDVVLLLLDDELTMLFARCPHCAYCL